jgi:hypothetical protein
MIISVGYRVKSNRGVEFRSEYESMLAEWSIDPKTDLFLKDDD